SNAFPCSRASSAGGRCAGSAGDSHPTGVSSPMTDPGSQALESPPSVPLGTRLRRLLLGGPKDYRDPRIFHHVSLIAFLAWVGLGADGLSSACYGPEEAYLALGGHTLLSLYLAAMTAVTVFVIAVAYNQVIELFPSGGGGYKVASSLLGSHAGLVSGSALIVDYVLTISISVASGVDALFSLLPVAFGSAKLGLEILLTLLLLYLNL